MKLWIKSAAGAAVVALGLASMYAPLVAAQAQPPGEAPPPVAPPADSAPESNTRARKVMLTTVVNQMKRDTGITILIDRSVPTGDVAPPAQAATVDTLESQLTDLASGLPKGTVWAKVSLPERTRSYSPDAVGDYVLAQAKLFGGAGAPTPVGTLEVMGQKLSGDKAQTVADVLALKTVYILINPNARNAPAGGDGLNSNWANMTPEQREQAAQQQAQALLAMTPEQRAGVMQQQMQIMGAMMQNMTPQQRQQMFQGMGGQMRMMYRPGGRPGRGN